MSSFVVALSIHHLIVHHLDRLLLLRRLKGQFYCGVDATLQIGRYAFFVNGPCSMTPVREVALHFASDKGMILQFSNDAFLSKRQCFFDCRWVAKYIEEDEKLFFGMAHPLRMATIIMVKSCKNYRKFVTALYLFDAMISGINVDGVREGVRVKQQEYTFQLLTILMNFTLEDADFEYSRFDNFMNGEWKLFRLRREEIILDLALLDTHFKVS